MHNLPELRPGDAFFVLHKDNWISRAIAWFMDSRFSHAGMILETTSQRIYTCETSDFEVAYFDFETYLKDPNVSLEVLRLPVSQDAGLQMAMEAAKYQRTVYGYLQLLVSFSLREIIRKVFHRVIPNFIRQGMVCCHVVLYACKKSGLPQLAAQDPEGLQTQETYDLLVANGAQVVFKK
jgi:hypothetical protein